VTIAHGRNTGGNLLTLEYVYDAAGNCQNLIENASARATWTYDAANQLLIEARTGRYWVTHSYDPAGNRSTAQSATLNPAVSSIATYSYDAANQLQTRQDVTGTLATYSYDAAGNRTQLQDPTLGVLTYLWDTENRLSGYPTVTNTYNGDGRRLSRQQVNGTIFFVYDGQNVLMERDGGGVTRAVYTADPHTYGEVVSASYSYPSLFAAGVRYYHFDALGSTRELSVGAGGGIDAYDNLAYGQFIKGQQLALNPFLWVGRAGYYNDLLSVAVANPPILVGERWHDPITSRWMSKDPIGLRGGDANLYRYVKNDPLNAVDPSGTTFFPLTTCGLNSTTINATIGPGKIDQSGGLWALPTARVTQRINTELKAAGFPQITTTQLGKCAQDQVCCLLLTSTVTVTLSMRASFSVTLGTVTFPLNISISSSTSSGICITPPCVCKPTATSSTTTINLGTTINLNTVMDLINAYQ
jgi:RHS repeat-associated protein